MAEVNEFKCPRPTTPIGEDLFKDYPQTRKDYFKKAIEDFISSAKLAIQHANSKQACLEWKKQFGNRYPCNLAKDKKIILICQQFATNENVV